MRIFHNYHDIYLYIEPLTDTDPDAHIRHRISNCFYFLESYLNLTTNQYARVKENKEKLNSLEAHTRELLDTANIMFGDLHFLLISMDKSYALSIKLLSLLGEPEAASLLSHSETRMNIKHLRNNLEHMDEKLTSQDQKHKEPWYSDSEYHSWFSSQWGTMNDNSIKLGANSFVIEETSFTQLWETYDNILSIIQNKYVSANKEIVDRIFNNHKGTFTEVIPAPDEINATKAYKSGDPEYQPSIHQDDLLKELEL